MSRCFPPSFPALSPRSNRCGSILNTSLAGDGLEAVMQRPQVCISEGTLLIRSGTDRLLPSDVETTPYSHDWKMVISKSDLDSRLSKHGWNLFFIATTLR